MLDSATARDEFTHFFFFWVLFGHSPGYFKNRCYAYNDGAEELWTRSVPIISTISCPVC